MPEIVPDFRGLTYFSQKSDTGNATNDYKTGGAVDVTVTYSRTGGSTGTVEVLVTNEEDGTTNPSPENFQSLGAAAATGKVEVPNGYRWTRVNVAIGNSTSMESAVQMRRP